jgi:DNA replication protein DnaC
MNADLKDIVSGRRKWKEIQRQDHHRWYVECLHEKNWVEVARDARLADVKWSRDLFWAVARGDEKCPACFDTKQIHVVQHGTNTGIYRDHYPDCECVKYREIWKVFCNHIPNHYLSVSLHDLASSPLSKLAVAKQETEIAFLKAHSEDGFFFLGPAGTSKTTFTVALYRDALSAQFRKKWKGSSETLSTDPQGIWRINGENLMRQFQEQAVNREAREPEVTAEKIRAMAKRKIKPYLALEEIDKAKMSEFRANNLFSIVDALYECNGRLVLTTNLTPVEFGGMFANSGSDNIRAIGAALMRRLKEMCHIRNYHE